MIIENLKVKDMKKAVLFCFGIVIFLVGCGNDKPFDTNGKVKIIEERDPIVKIIEEQDSMVVYSNDTVKRIIPKQE